MTAGAATLDELVGERSVFVHGAVVRAFEKNTLLAVVRADDAQRQRLWLESLVISFIRATHQEVWWVSGAEGWDYLLTSKPDAELQKSALGVSHWGLENGRVAVLTEDAA